jgi:tetratricopeptide (TPR) repeat protein
MFSRAYYVTPLLAGVMVFFSLLFVGRPKEAYSNDTILVLPFENKSGQTDYNWVGEGFSLTLAGLLTSSDIVPLGVEERNLAYERLGLQPTAILTRATAIKVGEKAGANLLVIGTYNITGEGKSRIIAITARVIDLKQGRAIGSDYTLSGPISDLQSIQGKLAWEILYQRNPALPFSRDQVMSKATVIPTNAFESYIKSLMTPNKEDKIKFLFRALSDYQKEKAGQYNQAIFALGHLYYDDGNYKDGLKWLERVEDKGYPYLEAQFYRGVSYLQLGDAEKAISILKQLIAQLPIYEVYNNAAVAELKKGDNEEAVRLLGLAIQGAPKDDDLLFNYGYALWRAGQYSAAANQLNLLIRRQTKKDGQAYYLLGKSLEKMNQKTESMAALDDAKKNLPEFAKWESGAAKMPFLARIKSHFSRATYQRLQQQDSSIKNIASSQSQQVEEMMAKSQGFFLAGRDAEAASMLSQVLSIAPNNADAHLLMGRVQERRGETANALSSLKAAVFWNPKLVAAHVLLGRIYLQQNNRAQAEAHLKMALAVNSQDREALALKRLIETSSPQR